MRLEGQVGVGRTDVVASARGKMLTEATKAGRGVRQAQGGTQNVWGATPAPQ